MSSLKKTLIFDSTCGTLRGHNYDSIVDFLHFLNESNQSNAVAWISNSGTVWPDRGLPIYDQIPWVHEFYIQSPSRSILSKLQRICIRIYNTQYPLQINMILAIPFLIIIHYISYWKTFKTIENAFKQNFDVIIFQNIDFYSILALTKLAKKQRINTKIRLVVRLIGVMENAAYRPANERLTILLLRQLIRYHYNTIIGAETFKYAKHIEKQVSTSIRILSIPRYPTKQQENNNTYMLNIADSVDSKNTLRILCSGQARSDKGYFDIARIAKMLLNAFNMKVLIYCQRMDISDPHFSQAYDDELTQIPNLVILDSHLSSDEYVKYLIAADIVLLPYDVKTYQFRGSAVAFDAIRHNKPLVAPQETAIGDMIERYNIGFQYTTYKSLVSIITNILINRSQILETIIKNQSNFLSEAEISWKSVLK